MPIRIEYNPDPTLLARAAQQYGRSTGFEEQRRQQVQELQQAQAQALDRLNSDRNFQINRAQVGQRDREIEQRDRLAELGHQQAIERDRMQEAANTRAAHRDARIARDNFVIEDAYGQAAEDAELNRRLLEERFQHLSPRGQSEVAAALSAYRNAVLTPENQTPEAVAVLRAETDQRIAAVMETDISAQPQWQPGQEPGSTWLDEHAGAVFSRDQDGDVRLLVRPDQTTEYMAAEAERARAQRREETESRVFTEVFKQSMVESPGNFAAAHRMAGEALRAYRAEAYREQAVGGVGRPNQGGASPLPPAPAPSGPVQLDERRRLGYITTATGEQAVISLDEVRRTPDDLTYWAAQVVGVPDGQEPTPAQEDAMVEVIRSIMGGGQ